MDPEEAYGAIAARHGFNLGETFGRAAISVEYALAHFDRRKIGQYRELLSHGRELVEQIRHEDVIYDSGVLRERVTGFSARLDTLNSKVLRRHRSSK